MPSGFCFGFFLPLVALGAELSALPPASTLVTSGLETGSKFSRQHLNLPSSCLNPQAARVTGLDQQQQTKSCSCSPCRLCDRYSRWGHRRAEVPGTASRPPPRVMLIRCRLVVSLRFSQTHEYIKYSFLKIEGSRKTALCS